MFEIVLKCSHVNYLSLIATDWEKKLFQMHAVPTYLMQLFLNLL